MILCWRPVTNVWSRPEITGWSQPWDSAMGLGQKLGHDSHDHQWPGLWPLGPKCHLAFGQPSKGSASSAIGCPADLAAGVPTGSAAVLPTTKLFPRLAAHGCSWPRVGQAATCIAFKRWSPTRGSALECLIALGPSWRGSGHGRRDHPCSLSVKKNQLGRDRPKIMGLSIFKIFCIFLKLF